MTSDVRVIQAACVLFAVVVAAQPALAQQGPVLKGVGLQVEYKEPTNPAHRPIYERLKKRQVLEQYRDFMSPLRLKRSLVVALEGCNGDVNAYYQGNNQLSRIKYCYDFLAYKDRLISDTDVLPNFRREDAIVGSFVGVLLHETGHAIFHLLDIPIWGREEDAADAAAAYVSLQFGETTARRILTGVAFVWRAWELARTKGGGGRRFEDYSGTHGTDAQRFYNTLCIALGSDIVEKTNTFRDFVQLLPERRRAFCAREYSYAKRSFAHWVLPHVDKELMKKVRATEWLRSEDGTDIAPPGPPGSTGPGGGGKQ
jgi:hypothetical protein